MKKFKVIIIAVSLVVILVCGGVFTVFAINAADTNAGNNEVEETMSAEDLAFLDEKDRRFEEKVKKNDENDLKALEILRSYNKTEATDLIKDKQEDCELMFEICDMLKNNVFSSNEVEFMERYLIRRLTSLDGYYSSTKDGEDILLINEIKKAVDYENYDIDILWDLMY